MTFIQISQRSRKQKWAALFLAALGGAALLAGCGGGSSSTSNSARARVVNAIAGGGSATVLVNSTATQSNFSAFGASKYNSVGDGQSTLTFTLSTAPGATYPSASQALLDGAFYSFILTGRADITDPTDARYPALISVADNLAGPPSNDVTLRVINTAPDGGNVDVLVNGTDISSNAFYKSSSSTSIAGGTATVQINKTGTSTPLVASQTISLTTGHDYTLFITEPTLSPAPTYAVQSIDDTAATQ